MGDEKRPPPSLHLKRLMLDEVRVPRARKRRPPSAETIEEFATSMDTIGLRYPISVQPDYTLHDGLRRLEGARKLRWSHIDAVVVELPLLRAELAEIDMNLVRDNLTELEQSEHMERRKAIYELLHPETRNGALPGKAGGGKVAKKTESVSFVADASRKLGVSPTTIKSSIFIAEKLTPEVRDMIRGTPLADEKTQLHELAHQPEVTQARAAKLVTANKCATIREALHRIKGTRPTGAQRIAAPGRFATILADPPWQFQNYGQARHGAAVAHYGSPDLNALKAIPVGQKFAADDAILLLWCPGAKQPEGHELMRAWGFSFVTRAVWVKTVLSSNEIVTGTGSWFQQSTEDLLIGRRGRATHDDTLKVLGLLTGDDRLTTVFYAARAGHSRKPVVVHRYAQERCQGPYLELFAREEREGWTTWGDELGYWLDVDGVSKCKRAPSTLKGERALAGASR